MNTGEIDQSIFDGTYFKIKNVNNGKKQAVYILYNNEKSLISRNIRTN